MTGYLLDTCICVFILRNKLGIAEKLKSIRPSRIYISEITIAELKYGAYKSNRPTENLKAINDFVSKVNIIEFGESIDIYAQEKNRLRMAGSLIDEFDLLIASAAMSKNLILVTDNLKHFSHVNKLKVENWARR